MPSLIVIGVGPGIGTAVARRFRPGGIRLLPTMPRGTFVVTSGMPTPDPALTSLSLGKVGVRGLVALLSAWQDRVHVASVTVGGPVASGTAHDPDDIAELYWRLHTGELTDHEVRHG